MEPNSGPNSLLDDKSNLAPRGRLRQPLSEANINQINQINRNSLEGYGRSKGRDEPPRPPPPRAEGTHIIFVKKRRNSKLTTYIFTDYYSSRRQIYDDDPIIPKTKQPV